MADIEPGGSIGRFMRQKAPHNFVCARMSIEVERCHGVAEKVGMHAQSDIDVNAVGNLLAKSSGRFGTSPSAGEQGGTAARRQTWPKFAQVALYQFDALHRQWEIEQLSILYSFRL